MSHSVFWQSPIGLMEVRGDPLSVRVEALADRIANVRPPLRDPWVDKALGFKRFREIDRIFRLGVGYP